MRWPDARGLAVVARREYQLSCRGLAFWLLAAGGCALAVWRASAPGTSAPLAAYQALQVILVGVGVIAILVAGSAAARDRRQGTEELILSKPAGTAPALVAVRFAAVWAAMATVGAIILAAAAIGQAALARTAWQPLAYADALARSLLPIGLATALGFSLASLFVTPLAAAVAAIYWVATPLTRAHMPMVLDWSLAQHWTLPALLVPALVALAASLHARAVRSHRRAAARAGWMAGVLLAGAALAVFLVARGGEDALVRPDPILLAIAGQTTVEGDRAPGFWLPDAEERLVGMSDFAGRPAVVAFWGPGAPESARVLRTLSELSRRFDEEGLACIAVCIDRDAAAADPFAREGGDGVAMLWDRGRHFGDGLEWSDSPAAIAYEVTEVPTTFVLDRERRVARVLPGEAFLTQLEAAVAEVVQTR